MIKNTPGTLRPACTSLLTASFTGLAGLLLASCQLSQPQSSSIRPTPIEEKDSPSKPIKWTDQEKETLNKLSSEAKIVIK